MVQAHPGTGLFCFSFYICFFYFKLQCKIFKFNVYVTKSVNRITVDFWESKSISTLKTLKTVLEKFEGFKKVCFSKVLTYVMMAIFLLRQKKKNGLEENLSSFYSFVSFNPECLTRGNNSSLASMFSVVDCAGRSKFR